MNFLAIGFMGYKLVFKKVQAVEILPLTRWTANITTNPRLTIPTAVKYHGIPTCIGSANTVSAGFLNMGASRTDDEPETGTPIVAKVRVNPSWSANQPVTPDHHPWRES